MKKDIYGISGLIILATGIIEIVILIIMFGGLGVGIRDRDILGKLDFGAIIISVITALIIYYIGCYIHKTKIEESYLKKRLKSIVLIIFSLLIAILLPLGLLLVTIGKECFVNAECSLYIITFFLFSLPLGVVFLVIGLVLFFYNYFKNRNTINSN